ncbi:MAG: thioredoxin family protein [Gemmataceae bacterium]|nr:thioredoxin family protein [Gemmataceae bacterium]
MRLAVCGLIAFAWAAEAGEYNPVLSSGDAAPAWRNLPGVDGKMHSLAELDGKEVVVVAFLCCSCPAVADYEERLLAFASKHASKVGIVAINVNTIEEDSLPNMTARAKEKKYSFPYLFDASQKIGKQFGAAYTPEFFVLDRHRKIAYMGAFDDRDDPAKATKRFVEDAVTSLLAGEKAKVGETLGRGCRVRYNRAKKGA